MGVSVTEIGAAITGLATAVRDFAENGIAPNLPSADTSASALGAALTIAQQALQKVLPTAAYNLGAAGIAVNAIALDIAKAQAADAEARGDTAAYWAAIFGQIAAIGGIVSGIPLLPPQVRALGLAVNVGATLVKEGISNRDRLETAVRDLIRDISDQIPSKEYAPSIWEIEGWPIPTSDAGTNNPEDPPNPQPPIYRYPPRKVIEEICRNPNFPSSQPTFRIAYVDPLAIDLDGDGIETVAANGLSGALFDGNADGIRTATGWLKGDDGWLVRDINGDGLINNGTEMFGDQTLLPNCQKAANGNGANGATSL